jgi:hypothetical protein
VLSLDVRDESAVGRAAPFVEPTVAPFSRFHDGPLTARDFRREDQESANPLAFRGRRANETNKRREKTRVIFFFSRGRDAAAAAATPSNPLTLSFAFVMAFPGAR